MYSFGALTINGFRDRPVANTFNRQDRDTQHLGLILPGFNYPPEAPALFYTRQALLDAGADVLSVDYAYNREPGYSKLSDEEQARWLQVDVAAAGAAGLAQRPYTRLTLVGKSLGTLAMGQLLEAGAPWQDAACIWLTPLLTHDWLRQRMSLGHGPALIVIGTGDAYYNDRYLAEVVAATHGRSLVLNQANHGLLIPGRLEESLTALNQIVESVALFLDQH